MPFRVLVVLCEVWVEFGRWYFRDRRLRRVPCHASNGSRLCGRLLLVHPRDFLAAARHLLQQPQDYKAFIALCHRDDPKGRDIERVGRAESRRRFGQWRRSTARQRRRSAHPWPRVRRPWRSVRAQAAEFLSQAVALRPSVPALHIDLAEAYRNLGDGPRAAGCCRIALQLCSDYPEGLSLSASLSRDGLARRRASPRRGQPTWPGASTSAWCSRNWDDRGGHHALPTHGRARPRPAPGQRRGMSTFSNLHREGRHRLERHENGSTSRRRSGWSPTGRSCITTSAMPCGRSTATSRRGPPTWRRSGSTPSGR